MKLVREQIPEHLRLPEPQAQANGAECAGEADHAKLIDEVAVPFVMGMVMSVIVGTIGSMRVFGHRYTSPHRGVVRWQAYLSLTQRPAQLVRFGVGDGVTAVSGISLIR